MDPRTSQSFLFCLDGDLVLIRFVRPYSVSDFVIKLLTFCLQLRNAGLSDGGLVSHLSEDVAASEATLSLSTLGFAFKTC